MAVKLFSSTTPQTWQELCQILLEERKITDTADFFHPPHPLSIELRSVGLSEKQLNVASQGLLSAVISQKKIVVFGDYDADGLCATTVMWQFLHLLGARVVPFIPHRHKHGYGINERSLKALLEEKPELVVTVDNGIVAGTYIHSLVDQGIDVIVTDHHQTLEATDKASAFTSGATAVVHTTELCGTTVAWFLVKYMGEKWIQEHPDWQPDVFSSFLQSSLDVSAIASIADQVPLLAANRSFVVHGLKEIQKAQRPGLQALCQVAGLDPAVITEWNVGFGLAPRLNAMGRLGEATEALRLLCGSSRQMSLKRAQLLAEKNKQRQDLTQTQLRLAQELAKNQEKSGVLVLASPEFHEGILGLLAGKLVEETGKPTLVIAVNGLVARGSARSVAGFDVTAFLRSQHQYLLELGGHPLAAGFSLEPVKIEEFTQSVHKDSENVHFTANQQLSACCRIPHEMITMEMVARLREFAPFGVANPQPQFLISDLQVVDVRFLGAQKQHLKIIAQLTSGQSVELLSWRHGEKGRPSVSVGQTISCIGQLDSNEYRGKSSLVIKLSTLID